MNDSSAAASVPENVAGRTTLAPVEKRIRVRLGVSEAFELFTREIGRWWPLRTYACKPDDAVTVTIEPGVGRPVFETDSAGNRHPWGMVTHWDPPRAFAMSWHPGQSPEQATRVSVQFNALVDGGCELCLVHDGWEARGAEAADTRHSYDNGWPAVLQLFADATAGDAAGGRT